MTLVGTLVSLSEFRIFYLCDFASKIVLSLLITRRQPLHGYFLAPQEAADDNVEEREKNFGAHGLRIDHGWTDRRGS